MFRVLHNFPPSSANFLQQCPGIFHSFPIVLPCTIWYVNRLQSQYPPCDFYNRYAFKRYIKFIKISGLPPTLQNGNNVLSATSRSTIANCRRHRYKIMSRLTLPDTSAKRDSKNSLLLTIIKKLL